MLGGIPGCGFEKMSDKVRREGPKLGEMRGRAVSHVSIPIAGENRRVCRNVTPTLVGALILAGIVTLRYFRAWW